MLAVVAIDFVFVAGAGQHGEQRLRGGSEVAADIRFDGRAVSAHAGAENREGKGEAALDQQSVRLGQVMDAFAGVPGAAEAQAFAAGCIGAGCGLKAVGIEAMGNDADLVGGFPAATADEIALAAVEDNGGASAAVAARDLAQACSGVPGATPPGLMEQAGAVVVEERLIVEGLEAMGARDHGCARKLREPGGFGGGGIHDVEGAALAPRAAEGAARQPRRNGKAKALGAGTAAEVGAVQELAVVAEALERKRELARGLAGADGGVVG